MNNREVLTAYMEAFVDELAQNKVKHAVVSPGSRSTPISLLLAEHPNIEVHINIDERSASFFALGLAKALREPVVVVCTSGTAAANYYPAIVEAFYARIPLIVLTADRPHELRNVGAPQAIDQIDLYGKRVKWSMEMAIPENSPEMVNYVRMIGARAVATSVNQPAGPVHLNFPIREPLVPNMEQAKEYRNISGLPTVEIENGQRYLSQSQFEAFADLLKEAKQGIIVVGELQDETVRESIVELAERLAFPILADPLSLLRSGQHSQTHIIETYDTFLRDEEAKNSFCPDLVLRFGAMPISKFLLQFLKNYREAKHLVVDADAGWRDPAGLATNMIYCGEEMLCQEVLKRIPACLNQTWLHRWQAVNDVTKRVLASIRDEEELSEGKLFFLLNELMPKNSTLFVGNSMPIRDLDTFFFCNDRDIKTLGNRGANGIDGIVSTALGVSTVLDNTVLVIGDLSFYHDMNGLLAAKLQKQNITILLINNDGGGIFSFLPQASEKEYFELLFGTPHGLDFSYAAKLYEGKYQKVTSWVEFQQAFTSSFTIPGLKMIEVSTERESNLEKHRNLWNFVSQEIKDVLS